VGFFFIDGSPADSFAYSGNVCRSGARMMKASGRRRGIRKKIKKKIKKKK